MAEGGAERAALLAALAGMMPGITGMPTGELRAETLLEDIPGLDSLRLMELLATAESRFGVELDPADLEDLLRLGDIATALERAPAPRA